MASRRALAGCANLGAAWPCARVLAVIASRSLAGTTRAPSRALTGGPSGRALAGTVEEQRAGALALRTAVQRTRSAERRRFGAPVWQLLGAGIVGVGLVVRHWRERFGSVDDGWVRPARPAPNVLQPFSLVRQQAGVDALLSDVRDVLAGYGLSLGAVPLPVRLLDEAYAAEGTTRKSARPPPVLRSVECISLRPGLTAIHAAQVLAHEYMHAWLWLQGFPPLGLRLEEGLCELTSYLYLLSCLREPAAGSALARDEAGLQQQIVSIESNAHPDYGGGFRDAVDALRGRGLHELLGYVREHAKLPPPLPQARPSRPDAETTRDVSTE